MDIDALANEIRRIDGDHTLGAGALAEALLPWLIEQKTSTLTIDQETLIADALKVASRGVQADDGHTYNVPARDLAEYAETIKALVETVRLLGSEIVRLEELSESRWERLLDAKTSAVFEKAHAPTDDEREAAADLADRARMAANDLWNRGMEIITRWSDGSTFTIRDIKKLANAYESGFRRSEVPEPSGLIECPHWADGKITVRKDCTACEAEGRVPEPEMLASGESSACRDCGCPAGSDAALSGEFWCGHECHGSQGESSDPPELPDDCDCEDREALVRPEGLVCGTCGKVIAPRDVR